MAFKVGDRVRVYGAVADNGFWRGSYWGGSDAEVVAVITGNYVAPGVLRIQLDSDKTHQCDVSPKQCRRLKKKERRRFWARLNNDGSIYDHTNRKPGGDLAPYGPWIEFIEVKPRPINANMKQEWNDT